MERWLSAPDAGLGEPAKPVQAARYLYAEVAASSDATLWLRDTKTGRQYAFDLGEVVPGRELEARPLEPHGVWIEILEREKVGRLRPSLGIKRKEGLATMTKYIRIVPYNILPSGWRGRRGDVARRPYQRCGEDSS